VDDFYTYHVAHIGVLVHNANNYKPENSIYIYEMEYTRMQIIMEELIIK